MSNRVYANTMEVSCKQAAGKSICAFPDVCFTPPQTPATPPGVPIPYPNTGMASDCTDGSSTVKVSGHEVMLKNKSYFKRSTGNEAGNTPKKGILTSKITGKVYFTMWSMDVKIEGENVVRHLDLTTHNHGSTTNTAPWTYADRMSGAPPGTCAAEREAVDKKCPKAAKDKSAKPHCPPTRRLDNARGRLAAARTAARRRGKPSYSQYSKDRGYAKASRGVKAAHKDHADRMKGSPCQQALRCFLPPYNDPPDPDRTKVNSKCCEGQTGHHLIPQATVPDCCPGYNHDAAPVICVEGTTQAHGSHKKIHDGTDRALHTLARAKPPKISATGKMAYGDLRDAVIKVVQKTFRAGCTRACLEAQLDEFYEKSAQCSPNCKFNARSSRGASIVGGSGGGVKI